MKRAVFALVIFLLFAVPASAEIATVVSVSPLTLTSSEMRAASAMQAKSVFCGETIQQWASSMGVFMTGIPTGEGVRGIYVRVYPRPLPGAAKMYATRAEDLPASVDLRDPRLQELPRESSGMTGPGGGGSYYYDFDPNLYPGPGAIRFYALIKNGKRWELRVIWFIGFVGKSNSTQLTSVFEYTTAPWSGPTPAPAYLRVMHERAGAGGRGGEYEDLALEQWEKAQALKPAETSATVSVKTNGTSFRIRFVDSSESSCRYKLIKLYIKTPAGQTICKDVSGGSIIISDLPAGEGYSFWYSIPELGGAAVSPPDTLQIGKNIVITITEVR